MGKDIEELQFANEKMMHDWNWNTEVTITYPPNYDHEGGTFVGKVIQISGKFHIILVVLICNFSGDLKYVID